MGLLNDVNRFKVPRERIRAAARVFTLLTMLFLVGCNTSARLRMKNQPSCSVYFELDEKEEALPVSNKDFKRLSKFLEKKYGSVETRLIVFFEDQGIYYCEFYVENDQITCLELNRYLEVISIENLQFNF